MSKFFCSNHPCSDRPASMTEIIVPEVSANGRVTLVHKILETIVNPIDALNFEDFRLANLLKNGVSYKSLGIVTDMRLGMDSEIDAFNSRLEEMSDRFFVKSEN